MKRKIGFAVALFAACTAYVIFAVKSTPQHSVAADALTIEDYTLFGISSVDARLMRYDFSTDTLTEIAVVKLSDGTVLTGIEASAYVPGNTNIYAFWSDPSDGQTKLVYVNIHTGAATIIGDPVGEDPILGAVAVRSSGSWSVYGVRYIEGGVIGGHFDVDTSTEAGDGTDAHVHQYDDKYNVTGVDAFAFNSDNLLEINDVIGGTTYFELRTLNAPLSTGVRVTINGTTHDPGGADQALGSAPFVLGDVDGFTKLEELKVDVGKYGIANGGLVKAQTGDVRGNKPGPDGEYRSGAFALQALAVNADGSPAYTLAAKGQPTSGFLWEVTMFWHANADAEADLHSEDATGELVAIDQRTGEVTSVMELDNAYDSLAAADDSGTRFIGTIGKDVYLIDTSTGKETKIGSLDAPAPALEATSTDLLGAYEGTTNVTAIDPEEGEEIGSPINVGMSDLGTLILAPTLYIPRELVGYD